MSKLCVGLLFKQSLEVNLRSTPSVGPNRTLKWRRLHAWNNIFNSEHGSGTKSSEEQRSRVKDFDFLMTGLSSRITWEKLF